MKIASACSKSTDSIGAVNGAFEALKSKLEHEPDLLILYSSVLHDNERIVSELSRLAPHSKLHGATSCLGVMTEEGFVSSDGYGLGILGITDHEGDYGVGSGTIGSDAGQAAKEALSRALENAGLSGALPELIWINSAPGKEEEIILGLEEVVGTNVPIIGGSSADNTIEGNWLQFVNGKVVSDNIVLTVMFPSVRTAHAFHSGYNPTTTTGTVTRAKDRVVFSIDGKPAAEVYNDWTNGVISGDLKAAGTILGKTTLFPIGRVVGEVQGVPYFRLSHPETVTPERGLSFFTEIAEGDKIVLMEGSKESLINRAGRVVKTAMDSSYFKIDEVSGALIIYCAGCMLTVQSEMDKVVEGINGTFPGKPFLGAFTFGEQGCLIGGENHHGNLMISTLIFGS